MENTMSKLIAGITGLILSLALFVSTGHAAVVMDDNTGNAIFKINGKTVTPAEAAAKAPSETITKCMPIKGAVSASGGEATAYKCKEVNYACSPKTGNCHWKSK